MLYASYGESRFTLHVFHGLGDVPVGLVRDGIKEPKVWIDYAHVADTKDGEGQPMFSRSIVDYSSLPDGWQLYRRLLAEQPDRQFGLTGKPNPYVITFPTRNN